MTRKLTAAESRFNNISAWLTPALTLLDQLSETFDTPFVQPISKTALSLITAVQVVIFLT
jgi:hypothetical protein